MKNYVVIVHEDKGRKVPVCAFREVGTDIQAPEIHKQYLHDFL
jgi:DNA-directed RNA polymerase subunit K/omega